MYVFNITKLELAVGVTFTWPTVFIAATFQLVGICVELWSRVINHQHSLVVPEVGVALADQLEHIGIMGLSTHYTEACKGLGRSPNGDTFCFVVPS